jgi:hypothetical protein
MMVGGTAVTRLRFTKGCSTIAKLHGIDLGSAGKK